MIYIYICNVYTYKHACTVRIQIHKMSYVYLNELSITWLCEASPSSAGKVESQRCSHWTIVAVCHGAKDGEHVCLSSWLQMIFSLALENRLLSSTTSYVVLSVPDKGNELGMRPKMSKTKPRHDRTTVQVTLMVWWISRTAWRMEHPALRQILTQCTKRY